MTIAYSTLLGSRAVGVSITPPLAPFNRAIAIVSGGSLLSLFSPIKKRAQKRKWILPMKIERERR
jgi:hypothetical protein